MFTIEIKINGNLIGHIYGRNMGMKGEETQYVYEYYEPDTPKLIKGEVLHDRDAGIRPLICKILNDIENPKISS